MKRLLPLSSIHWLAVATLSLANSQCVHRDPSPPIVTSRVQEGQLYQSGHSEFDGLFRELHGLQQALSSAPDEERQYRRALASALKLEDGATRQALADKVQAQASAFDTKRIRVRLDVDGIDADDEADTMAQAKVVGALDEDAQKFIEATAMATRNELRFAARLRRAQKRLEHLAHHSAALDPWIETTFGGQGPTKVAEVRRNLDDARRQFPLLTVRAAELADEARRTVQKLVLALTTDPSLGNGKEPPLIAPLDGSHQTSKQRPRVPTATAPKKNAPAVGPAPAPKAPSAGGGTDFEP